MLSTLLFRADRALAGQPDRYLTMALLATAAILVLLALRASPAIKAVVLAWAILP
jgi:hypothetical protein